jgi:hypothetical protein
VKLDKVDFKVDLNLLLYYSFFFHNTLAVDRAKSLAIFQIKIQHGYLRHIPQHFYNIRLNAP